MITKIGELFAVNYGQRRYHNKTPLEGIEGESILISSKGDDNGIYGFFDIKNEYEAPFITVPSTGTIGQAFVQLMDCSVDDNCLVLIPRKEMTIETLYQVAFQIRLNKWKYKYGRQITPTRMEEQQVRIEDLNINIKNMISKLMPEEKIKEKVDENKNIKILRVVELCYVKKKMALPQNSINLNGNIPYVTTTSLNNGVSEFADENPNFKGKCLTVALNGSVGETFFQINNFITSGDNAVLTLREGHNPYLLFYMAFLIRNNQWRYNYYRKLNLKKLENMKIPLPYKEEKIDLEYIEKVVKNSYGFDEIKNLII